jgi:hypothetical protein
MAKKRRKYYIDTNLAVQLFNAHGFEANEINWYQIRIKETEKKIFFDWFHTQGTLVINKDGFCTRIDKEFGDQDDLAEFINNYK